MIFPPVSVLIVPVTALKSEAKRLVDVAFVAVKLVKNPVVALRRVAKKFEEVALVSVAPVAERLVVDAFPKVV